MNLHEQVCGPLTILRKHHYLACSLEYRPGNKPDGSWTQLDEVLYKFYCISPGYKILSKYSIRDKRGSLFALTSPLDARKLCRKKVNKQIHDDYKQHKA